MNQTVAKALIIFGVVLIAMGIVFFLYGKISFIGKLPGDIIIKWKRTTFYFPFTTSILISIIISLITLLFRK